MPRVVYRILLEPGNATSGMADRQIMWREQREMAGVGHPGPCWFPGKDIAPVEPDAVGGGALLHDGADEVQLAVHL
jgi:hypothetical protein